jgi:hypothetical protein
MSRITEQAVLAKLTTHQWSGRKRDREVSRKATKDARAEQGSGAYYKKLAQSHFFDEFSRLAQEARSYHNEVTLPWLDGGYRLLPTNLFMDYQQQMRVYSNKADQIARRIRDDYPRLLTQAQNRLGDMYNPDEFPSAEQLQASFSIEVSLLAVPETADFRTQLDDQTQAKLKSEVEQSYKQLEHQAVKNLWDRLEAVIEHLSTRLHQVDHAERKRLHASVVGHVKDLVEILPSLNITGDEQLNRLAYEARDKLLVDIQQLRNSPDKRAETATAANDLLSRILSARNRDEGSIEDASEACEYRQAG